MNRTLCVFMFGADSGEVPVLVDVINNLAEGIIFIVTFLLCSKPQNV